MTWFKPKIVTIQKNIEVATTTQAIQVTSTNGVTNKEQKKNQVADTTNPLDNSTMPKGINVPPVPDEKINNSTLAGVDSNNNGVRDDIERYLAKNAKNNNEFQYFLRYVREYQKRITEPTPKNRDEALKIFVLQHCVSGEAYKNGIKFEFEKNYNGNILDFYANTPARKKAMRDFNDVLVGVLVPDDLEGYPCK